MRRGQAVTHPSTNRARRHLTSVIGREPVYVTPIVPRSTHRSANIGNTEEKSNLTYSHGQGLSAAIGLVSERSAIAFGLRVEMKLRQGRPGCQVTIT